MNVTESHDGERALTFDQLIIAARRSWWLVLLCAIIGAGGAYGIARSMPRRYTAATALLFDVSPVIQQLAGFNVSPDTSPSQGVQDTDVSLVRLGTKGEPAGATAQLIGRGLTRADVTRSLTIAPESDTEIVAVTASAASPSLASRIANVYAQQFIAQQKRTAKGTYRAALQAVDRQYAALPRARRAGAAGRALQQHAQSLAIVDQLEDGGIQIAAPATTPTSPSSPDTKLIVALGVIIGLGLGVGLMLLRHRLDRRIRDPKELEALYGAPLLGVVPENREAPIRPVIGRGSAWSEVFQLLRARLRYFAVDRRLRTIVVTSPLPGDGKTTVAYNLALAATQAGTSTLLIEADLRAPDLAARLGLEADPGLAAVLVRGCSFEEAIHSIALRVEGDGWIGGVLDVIPAGSIPPPNPNELLESQAMEKVLAAAREMYGLVIIDTPALAAVSDGIPVSVKADGVLLVSGMRSGRGDVAERVRNILADVGAQVLGVIANRVRRRPAPTYGRETAIPPAVPAPSSNGHAAPARRIAVSGPDATAGEEWE